jgi:hypothetical protein
MPLNPETDLTILKQEIKAARDVVLKVLDDLDARVDSLLPPATATRYQALVGVNWREYLTEAHQARHKHRRPEADKGRATEP